MAALCGRSDEEIDFRSEHVLDYDLQGTEAHYHLCCFSPKASIQMKLRMQSSLSVELPQPMTTDGCSPFVYINCRSSQIGLCLHLILVQHA